MAMLKIRKDHTAAVLRKLAKDENNGRVARRLLAIANALSGMSRADAARRINRSIGYGNTYQVYESENKTDGDTGKADRRFDVGGSEHCKHQKEGQHNLNQEGR